MVKIVNIVASGDLGQEFDLVALSESLDLTNIQYDPETFPGLQVRLSPEGPVMSIFSTGSYTITGVKTKSELKSVFIQVTSAIEILLSESMTPGNPEINNITCKDDLGKELDLSALSIGLGTEQTEYEPEQSHFVYYRPSDHDCVITIAANGQVVITGLKDKKDAERAFNHLKAKIETLFSKE